MRLSAPAIQATYSTLDPVQLGAFACDRFGLSKDFRCTYLLRGTNDIYKLESPHQTLFLRLHRFGKRSEVSLKAEAQMLDLWNQVGQPVTKALRAPDGEQVIPVQAPEGIRYITLIEEAEGKSNPTPPPALLHRAGRTLAELHQTALRFPQTDTLPYYDLEYCINESVNEIAQFLHSRPEVRNLSIFYQKLAITLLRKLSEAPLESFKWGLIHGDFLHGNFFFNKEGKLSIFDFDRIGYGWHAFEIATYTGHLTVHRIVKDHNELYQSISKCFLKGYEEVAPLNQSERELLPYFYLMRRLWMRAASCRQYTDWSNHFFSESNWRRDVIKAKRWAAEVCGIQL